MYEIRTCYWESGLYVHVYQDGVKLGQTQTYKQYKIKHAAKMAREWIILTKELPLWSDVPIWHNPEMPTE
jgi:hypothetical protein